MAKIDNDLVQIKVTYMTHTEGMVIYEISREEFKEWSGGEKMTDELLTQFVQEEDNYWDNGYDEEYDTSSELTSVERVK